MPYKYQPLGVNDIRLLTLHPIANDADSSSPIICTLEHVDLNQGTDVNRETQACKGSNYVWPEVLTHHDFRPLFRNVSLHGRRLRSQLPTLSQSSVELSGNEDELPWHRTWGDYVALSYTWGSETPKSSIILNGEPFQIRQNLHEALVLLRSCARIRQGFKLWVDSICINQADTAERSQQVSRIREIYASAWQVVTWLGPAHGDSDLAVAALQWIAARNRPLGDTKSFYREAIGFDLPPKFWLRIWTPSPLQVPVYRALGTFFLKQYWRRLWILQEVAIARADAPIACGNGWLTWDTLRTACTFIAQDEKRFGHEIIASLRTIRIGVQFEAGRDRVPWERHWASERMWGLVLELTNLQQDQRVKSNTAGAIDLTRPLLLGLEAQSELAEDRIYGLLGMKAIADRTAITPLYGNSLQETYKTFSLQLLSKGDLNTLQLVSRHCVEIYRDRNAKFIDENLHTTFYDSQGFWLQIKNDDNGLKAGQGSRIVGTVCAHSLPSWTICMICRPIPTARLKGPYRAGGSRPSPVLVKTVSNNGLLVQGMLLDVITSLGASHEHEVDKTYPTTPPGGPQLNAYGDLKGARTALSRTITADTTAQGIVATANSMDVLLDSQIWRYNLPRMYTHGFSLQSILSRNRELVLSGYTLEQLILPSPSRRNLYRKGRLESKGTWEAISWAVNVTAWRRLLSTKTGRMGLAPVGARLGDSVAILVGCDMPLVLRRQEKGGWIVIGDCYVHGVMYGEGILGHDKFEEITLY